MAKAGSRTHNGCGLFIWTAKTAVPVYIPLPPFVMEALAACR